METNGNKKKEKIKFQKNKKIKKNSFKYLLPSLFIHRKTFLHESFSVWNWYGYSVVGVRSNLKGPSRAHSACRSQIRPVHWEIAGRACSNFRIVKRDSPLSFFHNIFIHPRTFPLRPSSAVLRLSSNLYVAPQANFQKRSATIVYIAIPTSQKAQPLQLVCPHRLSPQLSPSIVTSMTSSSFPPSPSPSPSPSPKHPTSGLSALLSIKKCYCPRMCEFLSKNPTPIPYFGLVNRHAALSLPLDLVVTRLRRSWWDCCPPDIKISDKGSGFLQDCLHIPDNESSVQLTRAVRNAYG